MTRKRQRNNNAKWEALPWKAVGADVTKEGDFDDCMFFSLEEVDGDVYQQHVEKGGHKPSKNATQEESEEDGVAGEPMQEPIGEDDESGDDFEAVDEGLTNDDGDEANSDDDEVSQEEIHEQLEKPLRKRRLSIKELRALNKTTAKSQPAQVMEGEGASQTEKVAEKQSTKAAKAKELNEMVAAPETKVTAQPSSIAPEKPVTQKPVKVPARASAPHSAKQSWGGVDLHPTIVDALVGMQFTAPTPIQRDTIPHVITFQKDLIAAAETGSGKTLAYSLPVIQSLVARWDEIRACEDANYRPLFSLIVTPTRELALQVLSHINAVVKELPREYHIRAMTIVGGMAEQKQKRLLKAKPHIVIATPGRLWEFIESGAPFVDDMSRLQYFIIDEADRMAEEGAFMELSKIISHIQKSEKLAKEVWKSKKSRNTLKREKEQTELERMYDFRDEKVALHDARLEPRGFNAASIKFDGTDVTVNDEELFPAEFPVQMLTDDILARLESASQRPPIAYGQDDDEEEEEDDHDDDGDLDEQKAFEDDQLGGEGVGAGSDDDEADVASSEEPEDDNDPWLTTPLSRRQTLLFSATMMVASPASTTKAKGKRNKKNNKNSGPQGFLRDLMKNVGLRGNPAVIDMTTGLLSDEPANADASTAETDTNAKNSAKPGLLPPNLVVAELICTPEEKDTYTYYILHKFSGRTLIFSNSIDGVKKITNFLFTLRLPAKPLHAQMQQRQRLKTMDFFRANENAILVATDVAARGLDFPDVQHVLHYDIPRSAQIYIHRSGRTARANKSGIAISLVSPLDGKHHREICNELAVSSLPTFPVDLTVLAPMRDRVRLAVQISKQAGAAAKEQKSTSWLKSMAQAADLDVDDDVLEASATTTTKNKKVVQLRAQLNELLAQPLMVKKRKFIDVAAELQAKRDAPTRADEVVLNKRKKAKN